jgi:hypothetical protein
LRFAAVDNFVFARWKDVVFGFRGSIGFGAFFELAKAAIASAFNGISL